MSLTNHDVLVLNRNYQAVGVSRLKKVVKKMWLEHCQIVDMYRSGEFEAPSCNLIPLRSDPQNGVVGWMSFDPRAGEEVIHCVKGKLLIRPVIVRFDSYANMPKMTVKFNRFNLLTRDNGCCGYCGKAVVRRGAKTAEGKESFRKLDEYTIDHVIPKSQGGKNGWRNSCVACHKCNNKKGGRTPEQAGMKLLVTLHQPEWNHSLIRNIKNRPKDWDYFLGTNEEEKKVASKVTA
jgi:5-methylcytosine-specific restriction endonuclease McrA